MKKTPKLRFPEFSGGWEDSVGREIFNILGGAAFSSKDAKTHGVKWLKIANVGINRTVKSDVSYLDENMAEKYSKYIINEGDVVLALTRPILNSKLKITLIDKCFDGALLNQRVGKVIENVGNNREFIYYLLQKRDNILYLENRISGTDPPNLSNSDLLENNYLIPQLEEQEKIASFLTLIDKKIEKQQEKVEALEEYKKGIMQKIFSQEIRFKDESGDDYPEWKEEKAVELFDNVSDKDHDGDLEVLSVTQDRGVIPRSELDIDIKFEASSVSAYKKVKKDDFIISLRSFQGGIEISKIEGLISPAYTVFKVKDKKNIDSNFFALIFKSQNFINRLNTLIYGIRDGKAISFSDFSQVKLCYPSIKEQEKIVELFKTINIKISSEKEKLEQLKEWKKGLLQQMFV